MPVTTQRVGDVVILDMVGRYVPADIQRAVIAVLEESDGAPLHGLLFDVSRSSVLHERSAAQVRAMGDFLAANAPRYGRRLALVAVSDFAFGLMRMGEVSAASGGTETKVFRDRATALAWVAGDSR